MSEQIYIQREMTYTEDLSVITMENNQVFIATRDYKNIVDKVNNNIRFLKSELISLRKDDLGLLRQLIHINDFIQSCYQRLDPNASDNVKNSRRVITIEKPELPLVRQQSVPSYCVAMKRETRDSSICSSFEGIDELPEDDSINSDDDSIFSVPGCNSFGQRLLIRPRSMSCGACVNTHETQDDIKLENILVRNVELWKQSNTEKTESSNVRSVKNSVLLTKTCE